MRTIRANKNLIAVSMQNAETSINVEQTLDTTLQVASGDVLTYEPRREDNKDELTGYEEVTEIYDLGAMASANFTFDKAQPHQIGFLAAYALGSIATVASGTGYKHTITPINGAVDSNRDNPSFSAAMRFGDTVLKRRFASGFMDSVTVNFSKDAWVTANGSAKFTGKKTDNIVSETVSDLDNVTSLTLAANGVEGATADARLDSVHSVMVELSTGVWTPVVVTAVDDATPAVLTIEDPGGSGDTVNYKIIYRQDETSLTWCTFPSKITGESPLRVSEVTAKWLGKWDGSAIQGGKALGCEVNSIEWSLNNNSQVEFCFGQSQAYAGRHFRDGRTQTLKFNREFRDYVMQQQIADNATFAMYIKALGAEYESGLNYQVELIFPKVGILNAPISVDGKRLAEAGDFTVMEDATYGSCICIVQNKVATYAA